MSSRISLVLVWALLLGLILTSALAFALSSPFQNIHEISARLGFDRYTDVEGQRRIKIAILDNGFRGYENELGKSLPRNTKYHAGPVAVDPETEEAHGLVMAQIISGLLEPARGIDYELHLVSAFGYTNFEAAVKTVLRHKIDIVLFSQVWEYGGNGDGKGFINRLVSQATKRGILWVNAAGNFATNTFQARIQRASDDWAKLPGPNDSVRVRCTPNSTRSKCSLRAVLSWNDFKNDVNAGTDKDLDLVLTDDTLRIVASSGYQQMPSVPKPAPIGASLYPREIIQTELDAGVFYFRVKVRSSNFDSKKDLLRLTIGGEGVQLLDTTTGETLLPPADHPEVITIGASDSERSSGSARLSKPELFAPSLLTVASGEQYLGTSNAAAFAAAATAVLKALTPAITRSEVIRSLRSGGAQQGGPGSGLPLEILGFWPVTPGCFPAVALPFAIPQVLMPILRGGAFVVQSTIGPKVFVDYDPFAAVQMNRTRQDDMLIASARGFEVMARSNQPYLAMNHMVEVVQKPRGQQVCSLGGGMPRPPQNGGGHSGGIIQLPPVASRH